MPDLLGERVGARLRCSSRSVATTHNQRRAVADQLLACARGVTAKHQASALNSEGRSRPQYLQTLRLSRFCTTELKTAKATSLTQPPLKRCMLDQQQPCAFLDFGFLLLLHLPFLCGLPLFHRFAISVRATYLGTHLRECDPPTSARR